VPETDQRLGLLCVVSGPSGSGKTTLCKAAQKKENCQYSISCTTRAPRQGEVNGEHYHFLSKEEFQAGVQEGKFLEHATVHGNFYGTFRSSVEELLREGRDVVMDIDVQGGALVRGCAEPLIRQCLVDVFVLPPKMAQWQEYQYTILSGTVKQDFEQFRAILHAERQRSSRLEPKIATELKSD